MALTAGLPVTFTCVEVDRKGQKKLRAREVNVLAVQRVTGIWICGVNDGAVRTFIHKNVCRNLKQHDQVVFDYIESPNRDDRARVVYVELATAEDLLECASQAACNDEGVLVPMYRDIWRVQVESVFLSSLHQFEKNLKPQKTIFAS